MIRRVLKNKLVSLGYGASFIETKLRDFSISVDPGKYTEGELNQRIEVLSYDKPTAAIPRFFQGISHIFIDKFIVDGKIDVYAKFSSVGSQINVSDFSLSEKLCIVGITSDAKIYILMYTPSQEVLSRYAGKTYEDIFGDEREAVANDYLNALTQGGRLPSLKAKDIMYVLMTEYIIDIILIDDLSPRIRLYDNSSKFAEILTNYSYKYINRRINRIEFVEKTVNVKHCGSGVKLGYISNEPYLLLKEVNNFPDFPLNKPTYAWVVEESRQEVLAIYTASEGFNKTSYREVMDSREDPELRKEVEKLSLRFSQEAGYQISRQYLQGVFKKLNRELIVLPVDFIRKHTQESYDFIEPLRYKFSVIRNRREFESVLYNSIENNLNGRFKYRFVEKLSGIYLTIGNKLNYTDTNGNLVRKQSIADFNINYNAAVIKRETIIDSRSIPQLLGYIYNDFDNLGTDLLPVPSIEVVFYFPELNSIGREIEMYNGTAIDVARGDGFSSYNEIGIEDISQTVARKPRDPNEKYVTVRYLNSDNEILKENIIRDVPIGSVYTPDIIPIINDKDGKEWMVSSNQISNVQMTNDNAKNVVEVRYVKKIARVRINYINRQGEELESPAIVNMQVGELFDIDSARKFKDRSGAEWNLYQTNPKRFVVSENEDSNVLTLMYDVVKADVFITYKTRQGVELQPQLKIATVANNEFSPDIPKFITDKEGCLWEVANDSKTVITVSESDLNAIDLIYDEKKEKVTVSFFDDESEKVKDDIVEFVQVGKSFIPKYELSYIDIYGKWWSFNTIDREEFKVQLGPENNIAIVFYSKVTSTISISMLSEQGTRIKDDIVEQAQIGTVYTPAAIKEIENVNGLVWECIDDNNKSLTVTQSEVSNRISYTYKPLIVTYYFKYVDDEGNDLIPQKERQAQAGSFVQAETIKSLISEDQRGWVLSPNNEQQFKVNRHKEENIFKINYDKKLVNITLAFRNVNGTKLKEDINIEAQIGSEYKPTLYDKITADNGERWMIAKTEPEVLFVRENTRFILIYDEIKAKVVVKCINIADEKSIVNDLMITTKLGGVFVPNIQQKIFDKNKWRWKYVGEPAMSIVAKENEQENIIFLKYEPDVAKITLKFVNQNSQLVHKDVCKDEQIGKEVEVKDYEKIIEDNGVGWQLDSITRKSFIVDEEPDNNIVTSTYAPLLAEISTRYIDNDGVELCNSKIDKLQVGLQFKAEILEKVKDKENKTWTYSKIPVEPITVKEETNKVNIKYVPLMQNVISSFLNLEKQVIVINKTESIQVGTVYKMPEVKRIIDEEGKYWIFQKISRNTITVSEIENENIVFYLYDKELVDVTIKYQTDEGVTLDKDKVIKLQIGSIYTIEPPRTLTDNSKLSYIISEKNQFKVKLSPQKEENIFIMSYEKYMVHVYDKFINEATSENIIEPKVSMHQVGSRYVVTVQETVIDEEGKHWIQAQKGDLLSGSSYKVTPITVQEDEGRNFTEVKYKPKLALSTIRYLDPLGKQLKPEEQMKLQIGSIFDKDIPKTVVDIVGNKWSYNPKSKANVRISENPMENNIELSYEEYKGTVTYKYLDSAGNDIVPETTELIQIGSNYTPQFDMIITDSNECVWEYHERDKETLVVSDEEKENIVKITYIPLDVDVKINYVDLWGNDITAPKIIKAQLGSKYKPNLSTNYTNEDSLLYRVKRIQPEEITIKEIPLGSSETPNVMTIVFDPVNSDVIIKYVDLNDDPLREDEKVHLQVGSKYTPEPPQFIKDDRGNEWELVNAKKDEINVFENPEQNILMYSYDVAKADIIIRFVNVDGMVIKDEEHVPMQVGQEYVPNPEKDLFDSQDRKWHMINIKPVSLRVGSINNVITVTYQEARAKVIWRYIDSTGATIKGEERYEAQIGSKYSPKVSNKVIYNEKDIWRLVKTEPYEIIISENSSENVINLIYSNEKVKDEEEEKKKEFINPFANTINEEEAEELRKSAKENVVDFSDADNLSSNDDTVIFNTDKKTVIGEEPAVENTFTFEDPFLQQLAKSQKLSNDEKITIDKLNNINAQIVNEIRSSQDAFISGSREYDYSIVEELIVQEKDIIKEKLAKIIADDRTGSKMLKIFEHITASENNDKLLNKVQQKKAILISDYFIDRAVDDNDKIIYIIERGKNREELNVVNEMIDNPKFVKEKAEAVGLKAVLYYEKLMLDNYYKARTLVNDSFFVDTSSKDTVGQEIAGAVGKRLINQAINIFRKDNLSLGQIIEVESIIRLCNQEELDRIKDEVNRLDNKLKKNANTIIKESGRK